MVYYSGNCDTMEASRWSSCQDCSWSGNSTHLQLTYFLNCYLVLMTCYMGHLYFCWSDKTEALLTDCNLEKGR